MFFSVGSKSNSILICINPLLPLKKNTQTNITNLHVNTCDLTVETVKNLWPLGGHAPLQRAGLVRSKEEEEGEPINTQAVYDDYTKSQ